MSSPVNPFNQHRSEDGPEKAAAIKLWTRQNLPLTEESIVSVSEFACACRVVQTGAKNIEIAIMTPDKPVEMLAGEEIEKIVEKINTEKDAEASTRRGGRGGTGNGAGAVGAQGPEQVLATRPAGDGSGAPAE